ncbi:phosphotransferase family protein [Streptomyces sp. CS057]|uniref:phosphotransferase family protein n=1 Tax=Streptomyces sp. CS057 TaxID=1982764 RepID=UPI000B41042C|nr:aminoglycoside phosphotransferase family protein [Streptomyces sp. CS057]OWA18703.1 aminoglycoside phosphotransferase [Streptomyces sp. CS057]
MTTSQTSVVHDLGTLAHRLSHPAVVRCVCEPPQVLADRPDGTVVRSGAIVAKAHAADTDREALAARLALAADPRLTGILLPPLTAPGPSLTAPEPSGGPQHLEPPGDRRPGSAESPAPEPLPGRAEPPAPEPRPVTLWPLGAPVDPTDPEAAPWAEAAVLLARLHRTEPPFRLPAMCGPAKAARAVARMRAALPGDPAVLPVLAGWRALPAWARGELPAPARRAGFLCHGDLHLGQLVRHPAPDGPWLLIDVDDAGTGDPAWDLGRPAAWYAAGLLAPEDWFAFLDAYRSAGGPAVPADGDPWPELDVPARALTVQTAALALAKCAAEQRRPDEHEQLMIESCARIATLPPELAADHAS